MSHLAYLACWASVALLVHVYVGYPLLAWLGALSQARPVRRAPMTPTVSIVLAVYNGNADIRAKLKNLLQLDYPAGQVEIIVACDGCTDVTVALVQARARKHPQIRVLAFPTRRGKAACLNDAVAVAIGQIVFFNDVRQRLSPSALKELVANFADPAVGAAGGELHMDNVDTGFAKGVDAYWRYEKFIRHAESQSGSTIGVSGALYAIRRDLFEPLPPGTVLDDVLVPMRIARAGWRVVVEPRAMAWDRPSREARDERTRKIRTLAGNYQLLQMAPWLLSPFGNPLWFRFASHKLLRLAAPWLLLLLAASTLVLARRGPIYAAMLAAMVATVVLVAAAQAMPPVARWWPARVAVAFFYLNLFAAQALVAFARNRELHLW
jgi:cellulose synthase/poly-beta-1,6-N-acetylglucosamine synthase-like glycosyltransferase